MSNFSKSNDTTWCSDSPEGDSGNLSQSDGVWIGSVAGQNRTPYSSLAIVLTVIPVSVIIIVIVSGNFLVVVAVLWDKRLKSQLQNWLILSLAVADLLVGLLIMPITLTYELLDYWILGEAMCGIWLASDVLFVTASILNLCAISLDRYWSLTNPVYYATQRTPKRTLVMIGCVWTLAFLVCCPLIVGWRAVSAEAEGQCLLSEDVGYVLYSSCGSFFIPVVTLLFVYARIYRITRRRAQRNLTRTIKTEEALQTVEDEPELTTSYVVPNPSVAPTDIIEEVQFQQELCRLSSIRGKAGGGLLMVARNVAAITRGSMDGAPASPFSQSPVARTQSHGPSSAQLPSSKATLRRNVNFSSSFAGSTSRFRAPAPRGGKFVYSNGNAGEEAASGLYRSHSDIFRRISSLSLRRSGSQRRMGQREKSLRRRERQATSLLGLIMLAFVGCWMPFFCLYLLRAICCEPPDLLFDVIFWLGYCNSAFNPFIYNFFNREFRQAFVKILSLKRRQLK